MTGNININLPYATDFELGPCHCETLCILRKSWMSGARYREDSVRCMVVVFYISVDLDWLMIRCENDCNKQKTLFDQPP